MKAIKFKKKSPTGDTEHIFVTLNPDINGNTGYRIDVLALTKQPELYKHDYILRIFKGYAVILQSTFWSESTLREILGAIDIIKNQTSILNKLPLTIGPQDQGPILVCSAFDIKNPNPSPQIPHPKQINLSQSI